MSARLTRRHSIDVPCTVDLAQTHETLHAHFDVRGIDIQPGDSVLIHEAPSRIGCGEHCLLEHRATVVRAGHLKRRWIRFTSQFELSMRWEVGFSADPLPAAIRRRQP